MPDPVLEQDKAEELVSMPKWIDQEQLVCPGERTSKTYELESKRGREKFNIDVYRGRVTRMKATHHLRGRRSIGLVRVDINSPPHENPDGTVIQGNHVHLYREGHGLDYAIPLSELQTENFNDTANLTAVFRDFFQYCNVQDIPAIQDSFA